MKRLFVLTSLLLAIAIPAFSQENAASKSKVPPGSKIFIAPMEGDLHPFIAAEIIKKKLPVTVVTEESEAEFILTGASIKGDDKWYHTVFGARTRTRAVSN